MINMDTLAYPALINGRFAYVSVSRALHDARIYTNDAAANHAEDLSRTVSKTAATDLGKAPIQVPIWLRNRHKLRKTRLALVSAWPYGVHAATFVGSLGIPSIRTLVFQSTKLTEMQTVCSAMFSGQRSI